MSHVNEYKAKIANAVKFMEVCESNGASQIRIGEHTFEQYGSNKVDCIASCLLPGWRYRLGVNSQGSILYDHFGSEPNTMDHLWNAVQSYWQQEVLDNVDHTMVADVQTERLANGDIQITCLYGT